MNVIEAIQKRRSVRKFKPDTIPQAVIDRLLEAARLAPSAGNCQPWKFVVVTDREIIRQLAEACTYMTPMGEKFRQEWVAAAPAIIVACGSERDSTVKYYRDDQVIIGGWYDFAKEMLEGPVSFETTLMVDLAIALDHISLAARELGLGTCWVGGLNEKKIKDILNVPRTMRAPGLMPVGYPLSWPDPRPRKPLEEIVFRERMG